MDHWRLPLFYWGFTTASYGLKFRIWRSPIFRRNHGLSCQQSKQRGHSPAIYGEHCLTWLQQWLRWFLEVQVEEVQVEPRKLWILWMCGSSSHFYVWTYGSVSKPCSPGEHQNRWQMDVHPLINCIYRYWSIAIWKWSEDLTPTGNKSAGELGPLSAGPKNLCHHCTRHVCTTRQDWSLVSGKHRQTMFRCLDENPKFSYVA